MEDLLSGETLFSAKCTKDCVVLEWTFGQRAFDYVMKNASEPPPELREGMDSFQKSQKEKDTHPPIATPFRAVRLRFRFGPPDMLPPGGSTPSAIFRSKETTTKV